MNMDKYYRQIIGAKIVDFHFKEDGYGADDWPVFILQLGEYNGGMKIKMSLSQDPEGNGGGFAFLEDYKEVRHGS